MRCRYGCNGIHGRVLDPVVRVVGVARLQGASGQCAACEERFGPQVRCTGLPVATAAADLWFAEGCVSAGRHGVRIALVVATARDAAGGSGPAGAADAEGADANEHPTP